MNKRIFTIADCFSFIKNGANIKQDKEKRGYPITRIETTSNNVFNRDKVGYAGIEDITPYQDYVLEDGDLLMSHINSLPYLGRVVYYDRRQDEVIIHGMNLLRLKAIKTRLRPKYATFLFSSIRFKNKILTIAKKSVNQASFSINDLKKVCIELPTVEEQDNIVDKLVGIQKIIQLRNTQLMKLDELVKCRFVELFGDPLAPKAKWKTTSFGSEFEIFSGGTPSTSVSEYWDNGTIPWIGSNMCQDVILSSTDGKYITEEGFNKSSAKWAHAGYVIVALVGATIGKTALLTISTTTNQNVASVNVPGNTNYTPEYVYMLMRFLYAKFMELGNGGFKMANLGFIRQLPLPSPPIDIQREYSDFMNRIDKLRKLGEERRKMGDKRRNWVSKH